MGSQDKDAAGRETPSESLCRLDPSVACGLDLIRLAWRRATFPKGKALADEEMTVQIVSEGKEPVQGVAYLEGGTMIVVENG